MGASGVNMYTCASPPHSAEGGSVTSVAVAAVVPVVLSSATLAAPANAALIHSTNAINTSFIMLLFDFITASSMY